jgi:hypothetical protein
VIEKTYLNLEKKSIMKMNFSNIIAKFEKEIMEKIPNIKLNLEKKIDFHSDDLRLNWDKNEELNSKEAETYTKIVSYLNAEKNNNMSLEQNIEKIVIMKL